MFRNFQRIQHALFFSGKLCLKLDFSLVKGECYSASECSGRGGTYTSRCARQENRIFYFFLATTFDFECSSIHFTVALVCAATLQLLRVVAPRQEIRHTWETRATQVITNVSWPAPFYIRVLMSSLKRWRLSFFRYIQPGGNLQLQDHQDQHWEQTWYFSQKNIHIFLGKARLTLVVIWYLFRCASIS